MADVTNTRTTLDGLYKIVYPNGAENAIPDQTKLIGLLPFTQIGETFKQPVVLTLPGGYTYGGVNDTTSGGTAYDLLESVASETKKLNCEGYQFTLRETIGYGAAKAAKGGKESFQNALGYVFDAMTLSANRQIEMALLDGQSLTGQGRIGAHGTVSGGVSYYVTPTAASWAPGRWMAAKGHRIQCGAIDGTTGLPTAIRASTTQSIVSAVDFSTRKITYLGTAEITAVEEATDTVFWGNYVTANTTTPLGEITAGGTAWSTCMGIMTAAQKTGTVWGVDNTSYELIRGETHAAGSTDLSFDTTGDALAKLWFKGATGDATMYVSGATWNNLISPEVALRRHDASYKPEKVTVGSDKIEFRHLTGKLTIEAHAFMKEGEALIFFPKLWQRIGTSEITFEQDVGASSKRIFLHTPLKNGFELRLFSDQAPFTRRLGWCSVITGIVNS